MEFLVGRYHSSQERTAHTFVLPCCAGSSANRGCEYLSRDVALFGSLDKTTNNANDSNASNKNTKIKAFYLM